MPVNLAGGPLDRYADKMGQDEHQQKDQPCNQSPDRGWTSGPPGSDIPFPPGREGGLDSEFNPVDNDSIIHAHIMKPQ